MVGKEGAHILNVGPRRENPSEVQYVMVTQ